MSRTFNGTSDIAQTAVTPTNAPSGAVSCSIWANVSGATANGQTLMCQGYDVPANNTPWLLNFQSASTLAFSCFNGGTNPIVTSTTVTIPLNTWFHVGGTYDGTSTWTIYFNGVSVGSAAAGVRTTNTQPLCVGGVAQSGTTSTQFFPGILSDAGLWNTTLTAAQMAQLAKGGRPSDVQRANLVGYWTTHVNASPETDAVGNNNLTYTGTTFSSLVPPLTPLLGWSAVAPKRRPNNLQPNSYAKWVPRIPPTVSTFPVTLDAICFTEFRASTLSDSFTPLEWAPWQWIKTTNPGNQIIGQGYNGQAYSNYAMTLSNMDFNNAEPSSFVLATTASGGAALDSTNTIITIGLLNFGSSTTKPFQVWDTVNNIYSDNAVYSVQTSQPVTVDNNDPTEWRLSTTTTATGDATFPLEWGGSISQTQNNPITSLASIRGDYISPNDYGGTVARNDAWATAFGGSILRDNVCPSDFGAIAQRDYVASYNFSGTTFRDYIAPEEASALFTKDNSAAIESGATNTRDSLGPMDFGSNLLRDTPSPITSDSSLAVSYSINNDWVQPLVVNTIGNVNFLSTTSRDAFVPTEWSGQISVVLNDAVPVDWSATTQADSTGLLSLPVTIQRDALAPLEWLSSTTVQSNGLVPVDWSAVLLRDNAGLVDAQASLRIDNINPINWLAPVLCDGTVPSDTNAVTLCDALVNTDNNASVLKDTLVPNEWSGSTTILSNSAGQIEWLQTVRIDYTYPITWNQSTQRDAVVNAEWQGAVGVHGDITAGVEWRSTLLLDNGVPVNWLAPVTADSRTPIDWINTQRVDSGVASDFLASKLSDSSTAAELGASQQGTIGAQPAPLGSLLFSVPVSAEWRSTQAFDTNYPVDNLSSLVRDNSVPIEVSASLQSTVNAPISMLGSVAYSVVIPNDWGGQIGVTLDAAVPFTWVASLLRDAAIPSDIGASAQSLTQAAVEALSSQARQVACPFTSAATTQSDSFTPLDWGGILAVTLDAAIPLTWNNLLVIDNVIPPHWNASQSFSVISPADFLSSRNADTSVSTAFAGTVLRDSSVNADWRASVLLSGSGQVEYGVSLLVENVSSPIEWSVLVYTQLNSDTSSPIEWGSRVFSNVPVTFAWGASTPTTGIVINFQPVSNGIIQFGQHVSKVTFNNYALSVSFSTE